MAKKKAGRRSYLGELRRSQCIGYGPGAIIDFRAGAKGGGPVSVVAAALDTWNDTARLQNTFGSNGYDPHLIFEPRLQKVLGKACFRQPPIDDSRENEDANRFLRGYRFPCWLLCPECNRLDYATNWGKEIGDSSRWCIPCSEKLKRRVFAVPTRFVVACENGHLDEFPWHYWIRRAHLTNENAFGKRPKCLDSDSSPNSRNRSPCKFELSSSGAGLSDLTIRCTYCDAGAGLGGIFSKDALKNRRCSGRQPWMDNANDGCGCVPRVMQRGASNLYFPITHSSLSIPPWSAQIFDELAQSWEALKQYSPELRREHLLGVAASYAGRRGMSRDAYVAEAEKLLEAENTITIENIRPQEYQAILAKPERHDKEFSLVAETVPNILSNHLESLVRVTRLREVRVLTGFKRIYPAISPQEPGRGEFGRLAQDENVIDWLPAIETRGEGIFFTLKRSSLEAWLNDNPEVRDRVSRLNQDYKSYYERNTGIEDAAIEDISPTELLLHSFSHSIIKRLAFEAGYDAASLRERVYVGENPFMAGVLIYTATTDSEGTLGGLERMGTPSRFEELVIAALDDAKWCSSDPLCSQGISSISENLNLAACHSCLMLPETSCEKGNGILDRSILINDVPNNGLGFFSDL